MAGARAVHLPIVGESKRAAGVSAGDYGNGTVAVGNVGNVNYRANITLGGKLYEVQIDTGRSVFL